MNQIETTVLVFDQPAARAFDALESYFDRLHQVGLRRRRGLVHVAARTCARTAESAAKAWDLGAMVLARAAGDIPLPDEGVLVDAADAMLETLAEETDEELRVLASAFREVKSQRRDMFPPELDTLAGLGHHGSRDENMESVVDLLREIALEERGIEPTIERAPDGQSVVIGKPADPAMAALAAYLRLLEILESEWKPDPLVKLERDAGEWWFESWSSPARDDWDATRKEIREREFSFFDREMLSLRGVTIADAAARQLPSRAFTPRQRALLDGVGRSVCGVFVVRECRASMTVLEDIDSGVRYEICEQTLEGDDIEGFLVVGRLIPMPEIGWIRSPGSIISRPMSEDVLALLRSTIDLQEYTYPSVVVEIVNAALCGQDPPVFVPPVRSRKLAKRTLNEFKELMTAEGLAREYAAAAGLPPDASSELGAADVACDPEPAEIEVDQALNRWLRALREQAQVAPKWWGLGSW